MANEKCEYCAVADPKALVQCKSCSKWFCNGKTNTKGSHAIMHLVKRRHNELALHPESLLGGTSLECYLCGNTNIFALGYISAQQNTVLVLLCRAPCSVQIRDRGELGDDVSEWGPLISEFKLVPWLAEEPPTQAQRRVTMAMLDQLEAPKEVATGLFQNKQDVSSETVQDLPLVYENTKEYTQLYEPLMAREEANQLLMRSQTSWTGIKLEYTSPRNASFQMPFTDLKIVIGDRAIFEDPNQALDGDYVQVGSGVIKRIRDNKITLSLDGAIDEIAEGYRMRFEPSSVTHRRIERAMARFSAPNHLSPFLRDCVLGKVPPSDLSDDEEAGKIRNQSKKAAATIPDDYKVGGVKLNDSQLEAVRRALVAKLLLIQGPPGTGKTVTSTALIASLARKRTGGRPSSILACAPSNIVVDQLTSQLGRAGIKVLRLVSLSREISDPEVYEHTLKAKVKAKLDPELRAIYEREDAGESISKQDQKKLEKQVQKLESELISSAEVVCATCSGSGDRRLARYAFKTVIIDESTQAIEPECLIPVMNHCEKLILVGDHKQLGPVVTDLKAARAGLSRSLFERFVELGHQPVRLTVQYRMHPSLSLFPSNMFYDGSLQNSSSVLKQRGNAAKLNWLWPSPDQHTVFWAAPGAEEIGPGGTSFLNQSEASICRDLLSRMISSGINPADICIITPYQAQRSFLRQHLVLTGEFGASVYEQVEIESVDAFQGREKGYVILSCVRSNEKQGIGFLKDGRRLNVAITRAKYGLIITGNPLLLSQNPLWSELIEFYRQSNCLVQGTINNLKPYTMPLAKLKPRAPETYNSRIENDVEASTQLIAALALS